MPIGGGASTPTMTVAGASRLEWIEMSPKGSLLTQWSTQTSPSSWNRYDALVNASGTVLVNDLGDNKVEWSPDGSYFVVVDYRGIRAVALNGSPLWGPVATPEQFPYDIEFTPDAKHVVATSVATAPSLTLLNLKTEPILGAEPRRDGLVYGLIHAREHIQLH